ncbi:MAG: hypothetical protein KC910_06970 [Candidatus Eremiobacteraeota bacterium]|nr:hypothetical protein [Candidatus Eremiobacteraeota bacterium]
MGKSRSEESELVVKEEGESTLELPPEGRQETRNLEKVRDILFGSQARSFDRKLDQLEVLLGEQADSLRAQFQEKLDALEQYVKAEVAGLLEQLGQEERRRTEALEEMGDELRKIAKNLGRRLDDVDGMRQQNEREFRDQLLQTSKRISEELDTRARELRNRLEREGSELRRDKVDRSALASLLTDLAVQMGQETPDRREG